MTQTLVTESFAAPRQEDIDAWQALPRDEQLRRLRAHMARPECAEVSDATMSEILARLLPADTPGHE